MTEDTGKLGDAPAPSEPVEVIGAFLTRGYGFPDDYCVTRVVRLGGRQGTGLAVFVSPPGGGRELRIFYERESDCTNHVRLRSQAAADTKGLTRGSLISGPKAAMAMYEALCSMAENFQAADQRGETWEWVQQLRRVAATTPGRHDQYWSLRQLQDHDYSKVLVQDPPRDRKTSKPLRPVPILLVEEDGTAYITARHMAVFLHHDLGVENAGDDDRILTRLSDIGGERLEVQEWDQPGRNREHKVTLVLYRLPEEAPPEGEEETE